MKVTIQQVPKGEEEIIVRYSEKDAETAAVLELLEARSTQLCGVLEETGESVMFSVGDVYYFESVDSVLYAYLENAVYRLNGRLDSAADRYAPQGFARCSRVMAVNLYRIARLKSLGAGRILATMMNGENVVISRRYAGELRRRLRTGREI